MEIHELATLEEFQRCVDIQKEVWGFDDPFDAVPLPLLVVSFRTDGIVLGAFDQGKMVGFVYSLPGFYEGKKVQWSHMLAVIEAYRNSDIGYQLKMAQYRMASEKKYDFLEWTYDPLESRNAYFNLQKLNCIAHEYELNIYGETSSPLHAGTPTDRLIAHWPIPMIKKEYPQLSQAPSESLMVNRTRLLEEDLIEIESTDLKKTEPFLYLEIPRDMQKLKSKFPQAGKDWRMQTREIFVHYLGSGYIVYSFVVIDKRSFYVLKQHPREQ